MAKNLSSVLLVIILFILTAGTGDAVDLYIGDQLVTPKVPLLPTPYGTFIPASVLETNMAAKLRPDLDQKSLTIALPTLEIYMEVGTTQALVNGEQQQLTAPPTLIGDEFMIPLRFILDLLGFTLKFSTFPDGSSAMLVSISDDYAQLIKADETSSLDQPTLEDYIEIPDLDSTYAYPALRSIEYLGGSRSQVFIDTAGYSTYKSTVLTDPDRLVIDLAGVKWESLPLQEIDGPVIHRIRSSQYDENTARVVFDLKMPLNYRIHPRPDGGLNVLFNYLISDVEYFRDDLDVPRLRFSGDEQPSFQVQALPSPPRLILDFQESTLAGPAADLALDDPLIKEIRIRQFNSSTTRVVLDLADETPVFAAYVEDKGDHYEIVLFGGSAEEYQDLLEAGVSESEEPLVLVPPEDTGVGRSLEGRIIVIDPGHGGSDPGTIGEYLGVFEKDIALAVGLKLGEYLLESGAAIVYTRSDDRYVSVFDRPKIADFVNAEMFVSVHANSYDGTVAKGVETLFNPLYLENFRLAQLIQSELISSIDALDRGVRPRTDLAVLNGAKVPAVLVEVGFVTSKEEEELLTTPEYQDQIAAGIASGINLFFQIYR